ncbi:hypothetical protein PTKIN_Ptkin15bG0110700 [Pterospermum kingtungense]
MSEVVDAVISNPKDENQFKTNLLEDTAQSKSRSPEVKSSQLKGKNIDEDQESDDLDLEMVVKAKKWVGVIVHKELDGKTYMGNAVSFKPETRLYKIEYENGNAEEVDYQKLQQIMAPPNLVCHYLDRVNPR